VIGILYATLQEARSFLKRTGAQQTGDRPFSLFRLPNPSVLIMISGMGKVSAALAAQTLIREKGCDRLINAGVCGILVDSPVLAPGLVMRVSEASEGPPDPGIQGGSVYCTDNRWPDLPTARLVTVERPVFDAHLRRRLAQWGELVDMEGAVVARVAGLYGATCAMIKGITDTADDGQRIDLHRNLAAVSDAIAAHLVNGISDDVTHGCGSP
jgi:adenosylhomocysteine nucleosidase